MPTYRDKKRGRFVFEFDRYIDGQRLRATKLLPKTWNQAQADAFDRTESAKLYAAATGVERPGFTIEEAVARYLTEHGPDLKHLSNTEHELALMFDFYQARPLSALADVCKAYKIKAAREDGLGPLAAATVRNRIRYLTAACRWAWKNAGMGDEDPGARVVTPVVRNERKVFIDRRQMLAIAKRCKNRGARRAIRIAFYSGMRLSEILRAVPVGSCWRLDDSKNSQPRLVPIHPRVAVCARTWQPLAKITVQKHHHRAAAAAGLPDVHFHDLRHSAASELINAGVDLYTVGAVLGHKDSRSTQRYAHLATASLTAAVGLIGRKSPDTLQKKTA
ncbi:MAG: phage integrase [Polaromonas sp.]|nr:phage integrase [Polaromonas sp.]